MADQPAGAGKGPIVIELAAGQTYHWCRCGKSSNQPFCDGSHAGTGIEPMPFTPTATAKVRFCGCKKTNKPPFCDGSHLDP
ncbi:MAG: CDGSH iron-sulfur domain-containing protein [Telmatospirillum sp.]|nr:CDGSH iron-sulfur domain-containing protein [Telmatospirillum sp.]